MKLFKETNRETEIYTLRRQDTGEEWEEKQEYITLELVQETVDYLMNEGGGATLARIRALIANLYNCNHYPAPDIFSLMRNADDEHAELVVNIIDSCALKYRDSCFKMIDDLAPKIIDKFGLDEEEEKEKNEQ